MSDVFVVRNQLGQYWGKKKRWVDGTKPRKVAFFKHEDEGLNQLVELSSKDVELRGEVVTAELDERNFPLVEASEHLIQDEEDLLEQVAAEAAEDATEAAEGATEAAAEEPEAANEEKSPT